MSKKIKLGIIATHPIQYQVPWFRGLATSEEVELKVYFCLLPNEHQQSIGFGNAFKWDVPLLDGYPWECLQSLCEKPSLDGFFANKVSSLAEKIKQDGIQQMVITGWHAYPMLQALVACIRLGIPCMVRGESNAMRPRSWKARLFHRLLLPCYQAYLAIGEGNAGFYRGYGVSVKKIFYARYFIDNERFIQQAEAELPNRMKYRHQWAIPNDSICFLYVGKFEPKKRIFDILDALKILQTTQDKQLDRFHLLVVGSGELETEIRRRVETEQLPVSFAGFMNQSEISQAYVVADVLVLPSDHGETWGLVVNEAMVSGLPVLISDRVGCGPDLVYGKDTGCVFPCGDSKKMAEVMESMTQNKASLKCMADNARKHIQQYSATAAVKGTLEAICYLDKNYISVR